MLKMYIFNVGDGQCIFLKPEEDLRYCTLVDCGGRPGFFSPVKFIKSHLPVGFAEGPYLKSLILTNYDEDHFFWLPDLKKNGIKIKTVSFSKNLSSADILNSKPEKTPALMEMLSIKDSYTHDVTDWNPPYEKHSFCLSKSDFSNPDSPAWTTNNLSQLVFITYHGFTVCIPGDLETVAWENIINKCPDVKPLLQKTRLLIASHHGRDNGFCQDIFSYCSPECVIISDKPLCYGTQDHMASVYGEQIRGQGILFDGVQRKVLTTRNDGHILVTVSDTGISTYSKLGDLDE